MKLMNDTSTTISQIASPATRWASFRSARTTVADATSPENEVTCSARCASDECQATADWGQPYTSTISRSGNRLTSTTLVTAQMVSDEVTGCQAGETQVSVLVAK